MKNPLKPILVIGGILIIFLTAILQSNAAPGMTQPDTITATPRITATLPPPTKTPYTSPTPAGKRPPQCTFPLPQTAIEDPVPEEYVFSEPKVVLTGDATIGIVEWLPDSQRVLITRNIRDSNRQVIEVFNSVTGIRQKYGERTKMTQPFPVWANWLNAVLYSDTKILQKVIPENKTRSLIEFQRQLWMSQGYPQNVQLLEDILLKGNALSYISISVETQTHRVLYFVQGEEKLVERNERLDGKQTLALNLAHWEYKAKTSGLPIFYSMAWRPNTTQVFLYTDGDTGGYTFLLDVNTGKICELDFNGWSGFARWSPNGRYLAIIRAWEPLPVNSTDLTVLDVATGKQYVMDITAKELEGQHAVLDITWAPDNRHLLAIGYVSPYSRNGQGTHNKYSGLHLVDFISQENLHILPEYKFFAAWWGQNINWSPDGLQILARCPMNDVEQLCNITVQRR